MPDNKLNPVDAHKAFQKLSPEQRDIVKRQADLLVSYTGMPYSHALTIIAAVGAKLGAA